jgi:hypothetical protein
MRKLIAAHARAADIIVGDTPGKTTTVPVADRTLRLVRTRVQWWKVDVMDGFQLTADSITFSEMMVFGASSAHLTNSTCEGQTIHLGAVDQATVDFERGEVWTYVSAWEDAVMVLRDSLVDFRKGAYQYQTCNIAHQRSRECRLAHILSLRGVKGVWRGRGASRRFPPRTRPARIPARRSS